jgi:hypothetical protein
VGEPPQGYDDVRRIALPRHRFTTSVLAQGKLPPGTYGRLVGRLPFTSLVPLAGGTETGRHLFLAVQVLGGPWSGLYEAPVNIRSAGGTEILYCERLESLPQAEVPKPGFHPGVRLAYGVGPDGDGTDYLGLSDEEFRPVAGDDLYHKISHLTQGCDEVAVHGITYAGGGNGLHDLHLNAGTVPSDAHAGDDRDRQDGAVAFYFFNLGEGRAFAHWVFIRFRSQRIVSFGGRADRG